MKYVEEWKMEEVKRTIEYYNELLKEYNEVLEETKMSANYWNDRHYFEKHKGMTKEECINESERLYKIKKDFMNNHITSFRTLEKMIVRDKEKCGYEVFAVVETEYGFNDEYKCYKAQYKMDEEKCYELVKKMVDKHFETLQKKVEKKIGEIIKIESLGGYDYEFVGKEGTCKVEVILAGGYNIQRLHTRWIIKK